MLKSRATDSQIEEGLTVGQVAEKADVNLSAVRFYESKGLITAQRTEGNQRRFDDQAPCRIQIAKVAQRIGLSISEIRDCLELLPPNPTIENWRSLHEELVSSATRRLNELETALNALQSGKQLCELPKSLPR